MDKFELKIGNEVAGYVSVKYNGLYCHISCSCRLTGAVLYRLIAVIDAETVNIGICVPKGNYFCVEKRLPAKMLRGKSVSFRLVPKHQDLENRFIPIRADEPFAYITRLENSYLEIKDDITYIVL